ncbi:lipoprotein NlpI [Shewanella violacea]|uniref:Lipoprotein NlpI n=1 Tax=Shewanella violacea (strain JCM 10179 / CIP 106290 / LMG 19151 / DSS12) TaxID=637905 RepID=D4ZB59_SHEVD|nr:lipoprotein NlpI [Shewanella violacea]BAJ03254.1 TPR domain protein [Shewanella violacea DSS12]
MNQKMRTTAIAVLAGMSIFLTGCVSTQPGAELAKVMVEPVMPDYKLEITLAKLNEILSSADLTQEQRARFHYDRGVIYDSVGLRILSRIDFHQALKLQPNLADAYNFIGIYYTQEGEFEGAYEAFDAVLELSPEYDYAFLNRGIALYYGGRNELAIADMQSFYSLDPQDGYRALWLYLAQSALDPQQAKANLDMSRAQLAPDTWSSVLVDYYLGKKSRQEVFSAAKLGLSHRNEYAERLCEAYFYLAKIDQEQGQYSDAANYFRLALATNIYDFVEHRYARIELAKLNMLMQQEQTSQ